MAFFPRLWAGTACVLWNCSFPPECLILLYFQYFHLCLCLSVRPSSLRLLRQLASSLPSCSPACLPVWLLLLYLSSSVPVCLCQILCSVQPARFTFFPLLCLFRCRLLFPHCPVSYIINLSSSDLSTCCWVWISVFLLPFNASKKGNKIRERLTAVPMRRTRDTADGSPYSNYLLSLWKPLKSLSNGKWVLRTICREADTVSGKCIIYNVYSKRWEENTDHELNHPVHVRLMQSSKEIHHKQQHHPLTSPPASPLLKNNCGWISCQYFFRALCRVDTWRERRCDGEIAVGFLSKRLQLLSVCSHVNRFTHAS